MLLNKYAKFSILYFPLWAICSWTIYEGLFPHYIYASLSEREFWSTIALIISFTLLLATGLPSFFYLRKRDIRIKGKILIPVVIITSFLIFTAYSSYVNKMRLQGYIKDLENLGFTVQYVDYYTWGIWHPIWVATYSEFTTLAKNLNASTITVRGGVPSYFIFFFPRTIEIMFVLELRGTYVLRIN